MPRNTGNFKPRVSELQVLELARLRVEGHSQRAIARETGLSPSTVGYLCKRRDVIEHMDRLAIERERERANEQVPEVVRSYLEQQGRAPDPTLERKTVRAWDGQFPYRDWLDERDRLGEECARNRELGRDAYGLVAVGWPGGSKNNYDPENDEDCARIAGLIEDDCPGLMPRREIMAKLARAEVGPGRPARQKRRRVAQS